MIYGNNSNESIQKKLNLGFPWLQADEKQVVCTLSKKILICTSAYNNGSSNHSLHGLDQWFSTF